MFEKFDPLAEKTLTREERIALSNMLNSFIASDGWQWFYRQSKRIVEARRRSIDFAPLDEHMGMRIAQDRGAAGGINQMLEFPANTLAALLADLNPEAPGGVPEDQEPE